MLKTSEHVKPTHISAEYKAKMTKLIEFEKSQKIKQVIRMLKIWKNANVSQNISSPILFKSFWSH